MKTLFNFTIACIALFFTSCNGNNSNNNMNANEIFPKGQKAEANFTGTAWVEMLVTDDATFNTQVYNVTFEPGCRNYWHSHPGGQLLLVTSGKGYYQEKGKPIQLLRPGDVVEIKPDIIHWHGATPDSEFVHIGITTQADKGAAIWYGAVSDEEYNSYTMNGTEKQEQYTFELSDNITRRKVTFTNRYGITLTGDLYIPKKSGSEPLPAIAISGPFGAVKEQSSGLYASRMAEHGFVTLAFDPSYTGESGGEPRNVASPDINTEDFSAAVDFLGTQANVNRERIGIIGICGFGGFALNAAAVDKRIKAVVTASMYDMSRVNARGYFDAMTPEQRSEMLEQLGEQRWKDAEGGTFALAPKGLPDKIEGNEPQFVKDYFDYYKTDRGFHPRSINSNGAWTATNVLSFMNMPILTYINEISPRPILVIAGGNAHSRYFSEDAYKAATEPKELMIIPNAVHVDLYDRMDVIPFDKLESFFQQNLK